MPVRTIKPLAVLATSRFRFSTITITSSIYKYNKDLPVSKAVHVFIDTETEAGDIDALFEISNLKDITFREIRSVQVRQKYLDNMARRRERLKLEYADFGYSGMQELCRSLQNQSVLQSITLHYCDLNDKAARLFADTLPDCSLGYVDLSFNNITLSGIHSFTRAYDSVDRKIHFKCLDMNSRDNADYSVYYFQHLKTDELVQHGYARDWTFTNEHQETVTLVLKPKVIYYFPMMDSNLDQYDYYKVRDDPFSRTLEVELEYSQLETLVTNAVSHNENTLKFLGNPGHYDSQLHYLLESALYSRLDR
ncbi:hypothetical protein HDV04_000536 [Boothiomyces sp. JEL0838]|nr:hypothetical protein HDV04_000536 [Boothiomyces sp. JEL0838]